LVILFYLISILVLFRSSRWLNIWVFLELNLVCLFLVFRDIIIFLEFMIKYYIVQVVSSLLLFYLLVFGGSTSVIFVLLLKIGAPPFQVWLLRGIYILNNTLLFLVFIYQKFFLLLMLFLWGSFLLFWGFIRCFFACLLVIAVTSLKYLLIGSSLFQLGLILVFFNLSLKLFLLFYLFYALFFILLVFNCSLIYFFIYIGLPISPIFYIKWVFVSLLRRIISLWVFFFFSGIVLCLFTSIINKLIKIYDNNNVCL